MIVGALIQAGLSGVRQQLPRPPACNVVPAELTEARRRERGIVPLPASLSEALTELEGDAIASAWRPETMRRSDVGLKPMNQGLTEALTPEEVCRRHAGAS